MSPTTTPAPAIETAEDRLLNIKDVCSLLSFSRAKLYRLVYDGQLPVVRIGGSIRFRYRSMLRWMVEQELRTAAAAISTIDEPDLLIPCGQAPLR